MQRKYQNRFVTSIPFEKYQYDRLVELLPKGICVADEINEFVRQRGDELEAESIPSANKGPIRTFENNHPDSECMIKQMEDSSLDLYSERSVILEHINNIKDPKKAWLLKRQAKLIVDIAETTAKRLTLTVNNYEG